MKEKDIERIKEIALNYRDSVLGEESSFNMCWVITQPLSLLLKEEYNIENEIVKYDIYFGLSVTEHFCIKIGNKILDATADQFGLDKVYFGSRPVWYLDATPYHDVQD